MLSGSLAGSDRRSDLCPKKQQWAKLPSCSKPDDCDSQLHVGMSRERNDQGNGDERTECSLPPCAQICVPDIIDTRAIVGKSYIGKFGNMRYTFPMVKWKVEISCEIPETGLSKMTVYIDHRLHLNITHKV